MDEQPTAPGKPLGVEKLIIPNITRPAWRGRMKICGECSFCDQDVDAYPCDQCHTRH